MRRVRYPKPTDKWNKTKEQRIRPAGWTYKQWRELSAELRKMYISHAKVIANA